MNQHLVESFRDTERYYNENPALAKSTVESMKRTRVYEVEEYPQIPEHEERACSVKVTKVRTTDAAMAAHQENPEQKIVMLNFASPVSPGGLVLRGSNAQEESLCRLTTLYPTLTQPHILEAYYKKNKKLKNGRHTDACIYSPGVVICKEGAERLPEEAWVPTDVITCAAPSLRHTVIDNGELFDIHVRRAEHILHIAAANNADYVILGAFGCGVYLNDPDVVAPAFYKAVLEYRKHFAGIEFAIFCKGGNSRNYDAFASWFGKGV